MSVKTTIERDDEQLDVWLRAVTRGTICVEVYKPLRFVFRAAAISTIVATAIFPAMSLPPSGYLVLGALALGPDVAEAYLTRSQ